MSRSNIVENLPSGFGFFPTDQELVLGYLRRKVLSLPLPCSIISEAEVSRLDPWDLPGDLNKERYFFSTGAGGNRSTRATLGGYWKETGRNKPVVTSRPPHIVVGMKKTLVFFTGKSPNCTRTEWMMHEYQLSFHAWRGNAPPKQLNQENWVVCRIYRKKRRNNIREVEAPGQGDVMFDLNEPPAQDGVMFDLNEPPVDE